MANYALLKSEDYLDAGENTETKSDAKCDAVPPRIEENRGGEDSKKPIKTRVLEHSIAEAGIEPARPVRSTGF